MTTYEIKLYECYIKKCNNEFKKKKKYKRCMVCNDK